MADHPLGFDPTLAEDSGEWQLGTLQRIEDAPSYQPPSHQPKSKGNRFPTIPLFLVSSVLGGSFGTWAIHALNCNGTVENGIVNTAEAAPAQPETTTLSTSAAPLSANRAPHTIDPVPDIHENIQPPHYTPRHVLTPLESRFYSKLSPNNPAKDPVLYCRQEGKTVMLYNDIVDVMQPPANGGSDCAHLYRSLKGKYFYVSRQLAKDSDDTVQGLLGKQAARELDYRVERNGRFLKQEKPHGIKVGDTIHIAPYQERERKEKREYSRR
ncbi:MAG: hypothetical protein Q7R76_00455 [Candidatus Woesearchaeota archaeon]|nr:hypothetical protein [Candidatus Woesearchaeota archaeon]